MKEHDGFKFAFLSILALVINALAVLLDGYILQKFWVWFVIPIFTTAPMITLGGAVGLSCFVSFIGMAWTKRRETEGKSHGERVAEIFGESIIIPLITLGLGWIIWMIVY